MKILYGVQATGNGHISRSREIIRCLRQKGHYVFVIFSGRNPESLWDVDDFMPYKIYKGLTFSTHRGRIKYFKTVYGLDLKRFFSDISSFDASGYDMAISDFEPVTSRIALKQGLPSIGIGHQYAFYNNIPTEGSNPISRYIIKHFAPVDYPVGLHWHHFNNAILPPVVPLFDKKEISFIQDKILVYLPFEEPEDIMRLLAPFKNYDFFVYHKFDRASINGNIRLCPFSRHGFINDLKECSGVITNAGFELVSEALTIGKKILVKPLSGQMEQLSNSKAIKMLTLGYVMKKLDLSILEDFLQAPQAEPINYPYVAEILAKAIDNGDWVDLKNIVRDSWSCVNISY
ncbi:MAG: hypothetical protein JXL81_13755 [Deltaproteobacteria bacterium]|nr:hypothetical protein [Deltaproteobacteria bacterium]